MARQRLVKTHFRYKKYDVTPETQNKLLLDNASVR
jgi:hypothetical protein